MGRLDNRITTKEGPSSSLPFSDRGVQVARRCIR
jgi:hypothetical protein